MRFITTLIISLLIGACSAQTSTTTMAKCANDGSGGAGCINDQDASEVISLRSRRNGGLYCGNRVKAEEVLVIDMESPGGKASLEQAGPYVLLTEPLISIKSRGSMVATIGAAVDSAASRGCNLLLTGPFVTESRKTGAVASSQSNESPGSPVRLQKHLVVRMARLQE